MCWSRTPTMQWRFCTNGARCCPWPTRGDNAMSRGVYGVDRGVWDHPLFKERKAFSRREAWLWLVSEAAWKPRRVYLGGAVIALDRGQLAHSIRFMAEAWRWEQPRVVHRIE